jgi:hypothetical protein
MKKFKLQSNREKIMINAYDTDEFTRAYMEAILFAETDWDGEPLDASYDISDFSQESLSAIKKDCAEFQAQANIGEIDGAPSYLPPAQLRQPRKVDSDGMAGHDFWLTRAGHGGGFWDGDWPEPHGDRLTKLSEKFGGVCVTVDDDTTLMYNQV